MENFNDHKESLQEVDLSEEFLLSPMDFRRRVRELRQVPILKIKVNLASLDKEEFIYQARRLKAFLEESAPDGQERSATIQARLEQKGWEPNVFCSGVIFEEIN